MSRPESSLAKEKLIVALDFPAAGPALELARRLQGSVRWLKVGLELYTASGPDVVGQLRELGFDVFLDLKFHDIPNTVAGAVRSAVSVGAGMLTLHASGGPEMLRAGVEAARGSDLRLLAVSVLTSMDADELAATGVPDSPATQVERLARLAAGCGVHGMVCSAQEVERLRETFGPAPLLVVPGIRPAGAEAGDQKRIATPADALRAGASFLVVGRPITQADDPLKAAQQVLAEMDAALPSA